MKQPLLFQNSGKFKGHSKLALLIFFLCVIISSCTDSQIGKDEGARSVERIPDLSNILNLKGIPSKTTDRSVYTFSDLGAWHGYALPIDKDKSYLGSFIGPFIMTQENGVWISDCLAKMDIINLKDNKPVTLKDTEIVENKSYPNQLKQVFQTRAPSLLIQTQLIFITNRTALVKVSIENKSNSDGLELAIRWNGKSFLNDTKFSPHPKGIMIDFGKNENIGWIASSSDHSSDYQVDDKEYSFQVHTNELNSGESWETYLSQTFCFSEKEREKEEATLAKIFTKPDETFLSNENRWNERVKRVTARLSQEFNTESHQRVAVKCLQTLNTNWRSAAGFLKHDGLFPSYNYQWFNGFWSWDSWKHAVAIAQFDTELAQNQIKAMYDFQDEMGMIADCVYRDTIIENHNWRDTKPPLSAWAIWKVYQKSKDENFISELFPKIEKYHNWWYKYRDINQNGLCEYGSTDGSLIAAKWESGMDNAVRFDDVKVIKNNRQGGSINCESIDLNAYLFAEKNYLAMMADELGQPEKAKQYKTDAEQLKQQINERFYNEESGWFFDFNLETNTHLKIFGAEGWIPLWVGLATPEQAAKVKATMTDTSKFATYIPFPTLAADHPKFTPNGGYWRGPVWLDQAWFAIQALRNYGYQKEAIQFSHHLFDRLEGLKDDDLPIRENYHPLTGKGLESNHFSWSAAHLLMLLTDQQ